MNPENFAIKLCGHLQAHGTAEVNAGEWRLVGQEQDCSQLFTWVSPSPDTGHTRTNIGVYLFESNTFELLYSFDRQLNIIQASVNDSQTLLGYVVKELLPSTFDINCDLNRFVYKPYIVQLKTEHPIEPKLIENERNKQVMIQFLYKSSRVFIGKTITDKFLLMIHLECIKLYTVKLERDGPDDFSEETWSMNTTLPSPDTIVKSFSWTQWDPVHQVLYYIHYRLPVQSSIESEELKQKSDTTPTLSGLQFHQDLPHETVLNIPLNLPQLPSSSEAPACGLYEDDAVPLRIHDCSLDLQIISNPSGIVCICHHYLFQSVDESQEPGAKDNSEFLNKSMEEGNGQGVHFAYSITLLHHGYVTHCVIPNLMWPLAKSLRPAFCLYKEEYLLVHLPNLYTHMLDIGLSHEPACHIVLPANACMQGDRLVSLMGHGRNILVDLATLDIVRLNISNAQLISVFKSKTAIQNKLSILHYFLQHDLNMEVVEELIGEVCNSPNEAMGTLCAVMKEFLIGGTYTATKNCLPSSAVLLTRLLPFTTNLKLGDIKIADTTVTVSQEQLWNTTMMLLSPRQRIAPFRTDMWTRLWDNLAPVTNRFKPHQVLEKLRVSLACYQPEALSRCSTPLSPGGPTPSGRRPPPPTLLTAAPSSQQDPPLLPFIEMDTCTASRQEHIISVRQHG